MPENLEPGLYDVVLSERFSQAIEKDPSLQAHKDSLGDDTGVRLLSQYLNKLIERTLADQKTAQEQIELTNRLIQIIVQYAPDLVQESDFATSDLLKELTRGVSIDEKVRTRRPGIPLSHSELLTNASNDHRIGYELKREIESADEIDILVAFIRWSGLRVVQGALQDFIARGGSLRVITTAYMRATQRQALDRLVEMGAKIKVSYDTRRTRLHAKAWLIRRNTGFSTAFVGSSNLSAAAQVEGLEWNIRLSRVDAGRIIDKIEAAFNSYWQDTEFTTYDSSTESQNRFDEAAEDGTSIGAISNLEVHPYSFQREILEKLEVERTVYGRTRNLVVAATGTGKTVIAALDYRRLLAKEENLLRLLFVAHRQEILQQTQRTFREVLKHRSFGETYVAGSCPEKWTHVFASVQSLANFDLEEIDREHFGMIIIDEFHHAAAQTYQRLLEHFRPRYLLGLTATPERTDGKDILIWFDDHIAAELRIWDAIDRGFLVPFHYFGRHDSGDLSDVRWVRGKYDDRELSRLFTADDVRAQKILEAVRDHIVDPLKMRALGFCVSISHTEFMTRKFNEAGIPAACIVGTTPRKERSHVLTQLRKGKINVVFSVDVLGEGVDIPSVDTILMLRPTNSATVFLQQLGRGLRHSEGKNCLTVLDFISNSSRRFRFDHTLGAMLGTASRKTIEKAVKKDFPFLPSGCALELDRESQDVILDNLKSQLTYRTAELERLLKHLGNRATLSNFLDEAELSIEDFYSRNLSFALLSRRAGISSFPQGPDETKIGKRLRLLIHADDTSRLKFICRAAEGNLNVTELPERDRRRLLMLLCLLLDLEDANDLIGNYRKLLDHPAICDELISLTDLLKEDISHVRSDYAINPSIPLDLHAKYSNAEIAAAFNMIQGGRVHTIREGVKFDNTTNCNLLFVTIQKSEKDYSRSTLYQDYAISPDLFHWESQNSTRAEGKRGRRHTDHDDLGVTPLLFVRASKKTDSGLTMPYQFLGPVSYQSHESEQPMRIIWRMEHQIPADIVRTARIAA